MDYWYEGNLNENANRREKDGIVYYIRGVRKVNGRHMERYGVQTHFVEEGESYVRLVQDYVLPLYQPGDILSISEKVISMCQENTVHMEDVKVGWLARFLSRFGHRTKSGIGVTEPHKLQLAINMRGSVRVLFAAVMGALGKLIGKRGLFYKILGVEAVSYTHLDVYKRQRKLYSAVLSQTVLRFRRATENLLFLKKVRNINSLIKLQKSHSLVLLPVKQAKTLSTLQNVLYSH